MVEKRNKHIHLVPNSQNFERFSNDVCLKFIVSLWRCTASLIIKVVVVVQKLQINGLREFWLLVFFLFILSYEM